MVEILENNPSPVLKYQRLSTFLKAVQNWRSLFARFCDAGDDDEDDFDDGKKGQKAFIGVSYTDCQWWGEARAPALQQTAPLLRSHRRRIFFLPEWLSLRGCPDVMVIL